MTQTLSFTQTSGHPVTVRVDRIDAIRVILKTPTISAKKSEPVATVWVELSGNTAYEISQSYDEAAERWRYALDSSNAAG